MNTLSFSQLRDKFEEENRGLYFVRSNGFYVEESVESAWQGYKKDARASELLLEAYRAIVDNCIRFETSDPWSVCIHCFDGENPEGSIKHKEDCIVLKAEKYISEVTK